MLQHRCSHSRQLRQPRHPRRRPRRHRPIPHRHRSRRSMPRLHGLPQSHLYQERNIQGEAHHPPVAAEHRALRRGPRPDRHHLRRPRQHHNGRQLLAQAAERPAPGHGRPPQARHLPFVHRQNRCQQYHAEEPHHREQRRPPRSGSGHPYAGRPPQIPQLPIPRPSGHRLHRHAQHPPLVQRLLHRGHHRLHLRCLHGLVRALHHPLQGQ